MYLTYKKKCQMPRDNQGDKVGMLKRDVAPLRWNLLYFTSTYQVKAGLLPNPFYVIYQFSVLYIFTCNLCLA